MVRRGSDDGVAAPSHRLFLRPGVHAAAVGPDAVLLDVIGDAYHCLPDGARLCGALVTEGAQPDEPRLIALAESSLLTQSPPTMPGRRPPPRPTRSIIHDRRPACAVRDVIPALSALAGVKRARRGGGLAPYLRLDRRPARGDALDAIEAGRRFWTLLPYLPIEGECLLRSALLMRFLRAGGLDADWVFGVRLHPFAAHCWVQVDEVCLNDDVERLSAYAPIMVV
jgi:hypothetical protein